MNCHVNHSTLTGVNGTLFTLQPAYHLAAFSQQHVTHPVTSYNSDSVVFCACSTLSITQIFAFLQRSTLIHLGHISLFSYPGTLKHKVVAVVLWRCCGCCLMTLCSATDVAPCWLGRCGGLWLLVAISRSSTMPKLYGRAFGHPMTMKFSTAMLRCCPHCSVRPLFAYRHLLFFERCHKVHRLILLSCVENIVTVNSVSV